MARYINIYKRTNTLKFSYETDTTPLGGLAWGKVWSSKKIAQSRARDFYSRNYTYCATVDELIFRELARHLEYTPRKFWYA